MIKTIIKRDGRKVKFDESKIFNVVKKAFNSVGIDNIELFHSITKKVIESLKSNDKDTFTVEEVQDIVEKTIVLEGYFNVSKNYILYRHNRNISRKKKETVYKSIKEITKLTDRENANVGNGPSSKLLQIAEVASKDFASSFLVNDDILKAMLDNEIYPHDFSWMSVGTMTCDFIPAGKLLKDGFYNEHGFTRSPSRIRTASNLMCIILQSNQNDMHGGQAYGWLDRDLAPYVKKEFEWQCKDIKNTLKLFGDINVSNEEIENLAWIKTDKETYQAMEALVANLNTMHCRSGAQVPFSSVNIGTDTSYTGRMVAKNLLLAYEQGLGKHEQPLFPNIIFKVKEGINYEEESPNFDLLKLACRVTAKRLFPTFSFQDCTLNKDFEEDVPVMGCRTRVGYNVNSNKQTCESRGNISFTSINLPSIAIKSRYYEKCTQTIKKNFSELCDKYSIDIPEEYSNNNYVKIFFHELNYYIDLTIKQLLERMYYQGEFTTADFPFLMRNTWMGCENLEKGSKLHDVIKHGTLGIGFIGLAETLICLVGKHHGEDENANLLGHCIIKFLKDKADEATKQYTKNFSVIATPAEGLTGKLLKNDVKKYGVIKGVTDKDWYTNSMHIPVEYNISIYKKIEIEGAYSKYLAGGSIVYVELNESPIGNEDVILSIVRHMRNSDVAYGAINFPIDRCKECNHMGKIEGPCPKCGSFNISRVHRITGYLAEIENFNYAKYQEALNRVKHLYINK